MAVKVVAEVSANHGGDLKKALSMVKVAKECGADAVKFQAYTPDTITANFKNRYFEIKHPKWGNQTLYELYRKAYTPWEWFKPLKRRAERLGITFFATAFDKTSVDFLEGLNVPFHKIASFELVDLALIEYTAKTKKPLMLSTGMSKLNEIKEAVGVAKKAGTRDLTLLKCVSSYPAKPSEMNLETIADLRRVFGCRVGLSDHTLGIGASVAAVSMGAKVIEKHFTLSRKIKTPDSFFSIEPGELRELVSNVRIAEEALGRVYYGLTKEEKKNRVFRRSLFAVGDIQKGEVLTEEKVKSIRPGYGLSPKYLKSILGKRAKKDISKGTPLKKSLIK